MYQTIRQKTWFRIIASTYVQEHTHVSILAAAKVPLPAIKERLGHTNDKTTERIYLHITKQFKSEVADKFELAMSGL